MSFFDWVVETLAGSHLVPNGRAVQSWSAALSLVWTLGSLSSRLPFIFETKNLKKNVYFMIL